MKILGQTTANINAFFVQQTAKKSTFPLGYVPHLIPNPTPKRTLNRCGTQIDPSHLSKFYTAYGSLLKTSLSTLRKRDKKKEKTRSEQTTKRKKRMTEAVVVNGPKRGAGRRKRQRQLKAAAKQQESQKKFKEKEETRRRVEQSV